MNLLQNPTELHFLSVILNKYFFNNALCWTVAGRMPVVPNVPDQTNPEIVDSASYRPGNRAATA